jgi:hypothetical protein
MPEFYGIQIEKRSWMACRKCLIISDVDVAELADALDSKYSKASGPKRNYADSKDFLSPTSPARRTHLDCFGPIFRYAGYKKGYKAPLPDSDKNAFNEACRGQ